MTLKTSINYSWREVPRSVWNEWLPALVSDGDVVITEQDSLGYRMAIAKTLKGAKEINWISKRYGI